MTRKHIYLLLAIVGFVVPYYFLITFLLAHGFNASLFVQQLFGAPISTFFAVDLIIASLVFIVYLGQEGTHRSMKHRWIYLIPLFSVGLSFALPLFLFMREVQIESAPAK
jgi:hypothetical protein